MTDYTVQKGKTQTGITLTTSGDRLFVSGTANNVSTSNNTKVYVDGGTISDLKVTSAGYAQINPTYGGRINGLHLSSGGQVDINGGTLNGGSVSNGGILNVYSAGKANGITLSSGAVAAIAYGGSASGFIVSANAIIAAVSGGSISGGQILGTATVGTSGTISGATVSSGGSVNIRSGGVSIATDITSGGTVQVRSGGSASNTIVDGGTLVISGGGNVTNTSFTSNGGVVELGSGYNSSYSWTVSNNVGLAVDSGATVSGTIVSSGGGLGVLGVASGTVVSSGGVIEVGSGGTATSSTINGGTGHIDAGGTLSTATLENGAIVTVSAGASASNVTLQSYGSLAVNSGATVSGTIVSSGGGLGVLGVASGTVVSSGGVIEVGSGGTATSSTINGGTGHIDAGGTLNTATLENSAIVTVSAGASASNVTLQSYGTLSVNSGATVSGTIISSNGGLGVAGTAYDTTVNSGGVLEISSGGVSHNNTVANGGHIYADAGSTVDTATIASGGILSVASSAAISGVVTLQNGGSTTIWDNAGGTIDLVGDTNQGLTISGLGDGGTVTTVISGYSGTGPGNSDTINLAGVSATGATYAYPSDDQVVVTLSNGKTITLNITGVKTTGFILVDDGNGGAIAEVCFLAGSLIKTASGLVAVEDLAVGDEIITYVDGIETVRCVAWVGQAHCKVRQDLPLDQAGYPVRVLKDAIADGVPFKDMLITAEHSLFFDGKFVPVRMLVNGRSIFYDTAITSYDYYHVETEDHSVIMADGMLTESYLDTGNRRLFRQNSKVVSIPYNRNLSWDDAVAPLAVSRKIVESLFRQIEARADEKSYPVQTATQPLTSESGLQLITDTGATIYPARTHGEHTTFMIPVGVQSVRIISNSSRPCDVIGPFVDDRRKLGVLVGEIKMFESRATRTLTSHLHDEALIGWSNVEDGTMRWTTGDAVLPLGNRPMGVIALMSIQICAAGPYLLTETTAETVALQA